MRLIYCRQPQTFDGWFAIKWFLVNKKTGHGGLLL